MIEIIKAAAALTESAKADSVQRVVSRWVFNPPAHIGDERWCSASIAGLDAKGIPIHLIWLEAYASNDALQSAEALVKAANASRSATA